MKTAIFFAAFVAAFVLSEDAKAQTSKSSQPIKSMRIKTRVISKDSAVLFDQEIDALKKKLASEKDARKRYGLFADASDKLSEISQGPRPKSEEKALEMAVMVETFSDLPTKKEFDVKKCNEYVSGAKARMGNRMDGPEDPGVAKGLEILNLVCGS